MIRQTQTQKGNVLFLILIAVALFAALSYAVTQSTRSSGDSGRETNILNSAQITSYPNSLRLAVLRMMIDGRAITDLEFNDPGTFGTRPVRNLVFHPSGGGATFANAPTSMMDADGPNTDGTWYYNMEFEVPEIGITSDDNTDVGNDLIAFLPGVTLAVCQRINVESGVTASANAAVPVVTTSIQGGAAGDYDFNMDDAYTVPVTRDETLDASGNELTGHAFGCFRNTASGDYVYYHVINER